MESHKISFSEAEILKFEQGASAIESKVKDESSDSPFSIQVAEKTVFS